MSFHHATHNGVKFKTFIAGIFQKYFWTLLDHGQLTETPKSETIG